MRRTYRGIAALLAALFIFFVFPGHVFAGEVENEAADVVKTEEELVQWLESHTEGTVTLGGHIQLTSVAFFYGPVHIDTGIYGLTFADGFFAAGFLEEDDVVTPLETEITISGEGVNCPVVDVHSMGFLFIGNWNNYLYTLNITATGKGGKGGTALRLSDVCDGNVSLFDLEREAPGLIRSFGDGAVGVELVEEFSLIFFNVEVVGDNSTAVLAHKDADISLSRLSATGSGARAVRGAGDIVIDTCIAEPYPAEDNIKVFQAELLPYWMPVKQGAEKPQSIDEWEEDPEGWEEDPEEWIEDPEEWPEFVAFLNGGPVTRRLSPYVAWDADALTAVSFDELGSTFVTGELVSAWLRALLPAPPALIVAVRDPLVPCISAVGSAEDAQNLSFWTCDVWGAEQCLLWYSDDDGKTWRDCTRDSDIVWKKNYVTVPEDMIGEGTLCVLQVPGYGFSNVARFAYEYGSYGADGTGGDRIGTDRFFVDLSGEEPIPVEADGLIQPDAPGNIGITAPGGADGELGAGGTPVQTALSPEEGDLETVSPVQPNDMDDAMPIFPTAEQIPAEETAPAAVDNPLADGYAGPAAQQALPKPGAGTTAAIAVALVAALAALGGWVWLGRLRAVKK